MKAIERKYLKKQINVAIASLIIGFILSCVTIFFSVKMSIRQQQNERVNMLNEALIQENLAISKNACKAAGEIIGNAHGNSPQLKKSIYEFEKFYWGEMVLIQNDTMMLSARKLRASCRDFLNSEKKEKDLNKLKRDASAFTDDCRKTSIENWNELLKDD